MTQLSPMMTQYLETKKQYPDCILFYRLGDFYEMFFEDALTASKALEITLTGKECGLEERAPMCGVPYHAVDNYLSRLVQQGYKVAIAEQMEDPKQAKGLVKREVIRVVTPGTLLSGQSLEDSKNNYLMGIVYMDGVFGISAADISTGDYLVTEEGIPPVGAGPHQDRHGRADAPKLDRAAAHRPGGHPGTPGRGGGAEYELYLPGGDL